MSSSVINDVVRDLEHLLIPLEVLQQESARTNEANGVIAFLVGVLSIVASASSVEESRAYSSRALVCLELWHAGKWKPGPEHDPADWRER